VEFTQHGIVLDWLYAGIGAAVLVGLAVPVAVAFQRMRTRYRRVVTAYDHMSQGLVMFDDKERLVVHNKRYVEIYDLSPQVVRPGIPFREVLKHRAARANLAVDPEEYRTKLLAKLARGETSKIISDSGKGRLISVINRPLDGGGWVGTHEDVTE